MKKKNRKIKVSDKPDSSLAGIASSANSAEFVPSISEDENKYIDTLNEVYDFIPDFRGRKFF